MNKTYYTYILASKKNGTLYTGVTNDLIRRVSEHKSKISKGFTEKYGVDLLVWYAYGESVEGAITVEKKIKNRGRQWKLDLIEKTNPEWKDLSLELMDSATLLCYAQNDTE